MRPIALLPFAACWLLACAVTQEPAAVPNPPRTPTEPGILDVDPIVQLTLSPAELAATVGQPSTLQLRARTRAGELVPILGASWASETPDVVRVDVQTGALTVIAPGRSSIVVRWRGLEARADVVASAPCRARVALFGPATLRVGESAAWTTQIAPCATEPAQRLQFMSSDSAVLRLTSDGRGRALAVGVADVTVVVTPLGTTLTVGVRVVP